MPDLEKISAITTIYIVYVAYTNYRHQARKLHINEIWLLTLILLTFFFPITNLTRWISFGFISLLFIARSKKAVKGMYFPILKPLNVYLVINIVLNLFIDKIVGVVQFLSFGYDNAFHLMVYRGIRETSWLPVPYISEWWSDFGLFRSTPIGSSALFSFIASFLIGNSHDPTNETAAFFLINFFILLLIAVFGSHHILEIRVKNKTKVQDGILVFGFILTIVLTAGTLFVNGFPPYNLALLIILFTMNILAKSVGANSKLLTVSASVFCLILITPAPVAFLLFPGVALFITVVRMEMINRTFINLMLTLIMIAILAFIGLYSFSESSATLGWRQILAPGGVNKPNIQLSIALLICFFVYLLFNYSKLRSDYSFMITLSGSASMVLLVALNLVFTKSIQYYSIKQFYLWSAVTSVLLYRHLVCEQGRDRSLIFSFFSKAAVLVPFFSIVLGLNTSNGFMQSLPNSLLAISSQNNSQRYLVDGSTQIRLSNIHKIPEDTCIFYRVVGQESDLNSRWANALSSPIFMPEDCFGIYWNSSNLSLMEIESRAAQKNISLVYVLGANSDINFQDLLEKNSFFVIGRKLSGE